MIFRRTTVRGVTWLVISLIGSEEEDVPSVAIQARTEIEKAQHQVTKHHALQLH